MIINGLFVAIGAFIGAISRYIISRWVDSKMKSRFPFGTITVNLIGSFLLGLIIALDPDNYLSLCLGTGFMGSFTTFSSFKVESVNLGRDKQWHLMSRYIFYSYGLGFVLAFVGILVGKTI